MRLDALVYAADAIELSWHLLCHNAATAGRNITESPPALRTGLFVAAWSIIDHLDAVRQLIGRLRPEVNQLGPKTIEFLEALQPVRTLRNKRHHLSENLPNMARITGTRSALLGALSYLVGPKTPTDPFHIVVVHSGTLHGKESMMAVNPAGRNIRLPVDLFQLDAFGCVVELSPLIISYKDWLIRHEKSMSEELDEIIPKLSEEHGVAEDELRKTNAGGLAVVLEARPGPTA